MPEFILDLGFSEHAKAFRQLDSFTQGYIEAMFFTDCEHGTARDLFALPGDTVWNPEKHSSLPGDATLADLSPEALEACVATCTAFQKANETFLGDARNLIPGEAGLQYGRNELDDRRLGQLFWYARCGHGVSFTDDGSAYCLEALQKAAQRVGDVDSYLGDDSLIYLA